MHRKSAGYAMIWYALRDVRGVSLNEIVTGALETLVKEADAA